MGIPSLPLLFSSLAPSLPIFRSCQIFNENNNINNSKMPRNLQIDTEELACTYSALILHDSELPISSDRISVLLKAAGVKVAPYWPKLFAQTFLRNDIGEVIVRGANSGAPAPAPTNSAPKPISAPVPLKKEEPKKKVESSDDEGDDWGSINIFFD